MLVCDLGVLFGGANEVRVVSGYILASSATLTVSLSRVIFSEYDPIGALKSVRTWPDSGSSDSWARHPRYGHD